MAVAFNDRLSALRAIREMLAKETEAQKVDKTVLRTPHRDHDHQEIGGLQRKTLLRAVELTALAQASRDVRGKPVLPVYESKRWEGNPVKTMVRSRLDEIRKSFSHLLPALTCSKVAVQGE